MNERSDSYFPEILDEGSSYLSLSPLTGIIQELRRKNVVTAAAASGPQMSLLDSSDPWGSSEVFGVDDEHLTLASNGSSCSCAANNKTSPIRGVSWTGLRYGTKEASFGYSSPVRSDEDNGVDSADIRSALGSESSKADICPACGKARASGANEMDPWAMNPRRIRFSSWLDRTRTERLEAPRHAEALLQSTSHLRIISQASTDMQGVGTASSTNLFRFILPSSSQKQNPSNSSSEMNGSARLMTLDYRASLVRDRANQQAATELSSLLWILAHEMSLEDYGTVESEVFTSVFALVHASENEKRMAGLAALDSLIDAPSADEEKKAIKFANTLSNGLRSAHGDYEFLSAVSKALGHMATRTANVDFVESEVTRALEWLRTDRSDRR
jgi:hypothetical protein